MGKSTLFAESKRLHSQSVPAAASMLDNDGQKPITDAWTPGLSLSMWSILQNLFVMRLCKQERGVWGTRGRGGGGGGHSAAEL